MVELKFTPAKDTKTIINDYVLAGKFSNHNAGMSRWSFCEKDGKQYFIKELLSPVFPENPGALSEKKYQAVLANCNQFFEDRKLFYSTLKENCHSGNNVIPVDFFRWGHHYYVVQDRLSFETVQMEQVAAAEKDVKNTLCSSLMYSILLLHRQGIVHGDLKPDNILLKYTSEGYITGKIIDFESSFFQKQQNYVEDEIVGDQVFLSPEAFLLMMEEGDDPITCKADIFAMGLIIHQYWTGRLPEFEEDYAFLAALNGNPIRVASEIPPKIRAMIQRMLSLRPEERPTAEEVFQLFRNHSGFAKPVDLD